MSRRESRSSLGARQTNALEEFENFKKKYLLVNKHIAKLNSALNVRIEELLSQIAVLNNDNLRLRASELSLARKLANEQDMKRRLYRETESASQLLMDQVKSMKIMFGLDRPANAVILKTVVAPRQKAVRPSQPAVNRLARAPEFDMINEAAEEDQTPSKQAARRDSSYPSPTASTPTRRRSTGSTGTPRSTPAGNSAASPEDRTSARSSGEPRKSTPPISMEISNDSSPLSPSPSISITNQLAPISPSPIISANNQVSVTSPPTVDNTGVGENEATEIGKPSQGTSAAASSMSLPHLNLFGLKRVSRRPSGLLMGEPSQSKDSEESSIKNTQLSVSVSIPSADIPTASSGSAAYPTPLSPNPAPRTPPRQLMTLAPSESDAPITPTRKLPMSPVLTANPALSPPPAKKLSLTRRQLDFGIPESEQGNKEDEDDDGRNSDDGFLDFQNDSRAGRRALKRKILEDEEDEAIVAKVDKEPAIRGKRQEKRRDTGAVLTCLSLKEKGSKGSLIGEGMESKESLRDVTNERSSAPSAQTQDVKQVKPTSSTVMERSNILEARTETRVHVSAGLAARIQRLESRAHAPLVSPIPLPPQEATPAAVEETNEQSSESVEAANNMDLGRRGSGRVRKSVNYREPSLVTKMRKPDPTPPPPTPLSSARSSGEVLSSIIYRPPKRKKGSISLVDMVGSGTSSASVTPSGSSESGKKTSEGDRVRSLTEGLLRTRRTARDIDLDLSSSDEDFQADADGQSRLAGEGSKTSKSSSKSSKGLSILSKGANPIISPSSTGYSLVPALTMPSQSSVTRTRDPFIVPAGRARVAEEATMNDREGTDGVVI